MFAAGMGRGGMFLLLLFFHFHSFSSFSPIPLFYILFYLFCLLSSIFCETTQNDPQVSNLQYMIEVAKALSYNQNFIL